MQVHRLRRGLWESSKRGVEYDYQTAPEILAAVNSLLPLDPSAMTRDLRYISTAHRYASNERYL